MQGAARKGVEGVRPLQGILAVLWRHLASWECPSSGVGDIPFLFVETPDSPGKGMLRFDLPAVLRGQGQWESGFSKDSEVVVVLAVLDLVAA